MVDVTDRQYEQKIEDSIQAKGLTAPRVTPDDLDQAMAAADIQYHVFPDTTVTVCCATLDNGYALVGKAAAASPENFDADVGREVAYKDARNQLWALLGFRLRDSLSKYAVTS